MKKTSIGIALIAVAVAVTACTSKNQSSVGTQDQAEARRTIPSMAPVENSSESSTKETSQDIALTITSPTANTTVTTSAITVRGTTAPNAEVFVNDIELKANAKGEFSTPVTLDVGENVISIAANDDDGKSAEQEVTVTYEEQ